VTTLQKIIRWISSLIGAISCWWMAYAIYRALHLKQREVFGMPIMAIYLLEFILVHAGSIPLIAASKESKPAKIVSLSLVSTIYVVFITTAAAKFHNSQLLLTFFGIMIPRWTGFFTDSDAVRQQQISRSAESILAFVFTIIPIVLLLDSPNPFGPALVAYFTVMGLLEGTSPLRTKGLDKSQRAGCVIGVLALIIVFVILGVGFYRAVFAPLFHK
jgi:hypothetical protein